MPPTRPAPPARTPALALALSFIGALWPATARAGTIPPDYGFQWATITHPGNAPYQDNVGNPRLIGRVDSVYRISKTEVSAADWAPFANANFRIGDPWGTGLEAYFSQKLEVGPDGLRPRTDIPAGDRINMGSMSWYEAARYCNWLHNNKAETRAAIEYGAYDLRNLPPTGNPATPPTRLPGALFFLPTTDEWVKAVHFDPDRYGENQPGYWDYPYSSDTAPIPGPQGVGTTNAGYFPGGTDPLAFRVGAYADVVTPWGLWDASGGVSEWLEEAYPGVIRGHGVEGEPSAGVFSFSPTLDHVLQTWSEPPTLRNYWVGFRIASVPSTPTVGAIATCAVLFVGSRRREHR